MISLTPALLVGIGAAYTDLAAVISAFTIQYIILVAVTIIGGILGQALGGDKDSRNAGAIFGAIVGGDKAANGTRQVVTGYKTERQCSEVIVRQEQRQIKNYSITYRWNGVTGQSYTYNQYSVGDRIPVTVSINAQ